MSRQMTRKVWEHSRAKGTVRLLLLALGDCHTAEHGCFPSLDTLADMLQVDRRQVLKLMSKAEAIGELSRTPGMGRGHFTTYHLTPGGKGVAQDTDSAPEKVSEKVSSSAEKVSPGTGNGVLQDGPSVTGEERKSERSTGTIERPIFDGRNLYAFHAALIGFRSSEAQLDTLDNCVKLAKGDFQLVADCMDAVPNPRRFGWLGEVGDLIRETVDARQLQADQGRGDNGHAPLMGAVA